MQMFPMGHVGLVNGSYTETSYPSLCSCWVLPCVKVVTNGLGASTVDAVHPGNENRHDLVDGPPGGNRSMLPLGYVTVSH